MTCNPDKGWLQETEVTVPRGQLAFFVWALGGYDNLCSAEVVRKQKGKVILRYDSNIESEVMKVIDCLFNEMGEAGLTPGGEQR